MKGKCINCLGCNRLELEDFEGVYRCENYVECIFKEREKEEKCQENSKK